MRANSARTILVVDDEHALADTLLAILQLAGYSGMVAYGSEQALGILDRTRPSLLISDVMMPGMNGVELAMHACRMHPGMKVFLISGHAGTQEILDTTQGACSFELVAKPIAPAELLEKVGELLASECGAA